MLTNRIWLYLVSHCVVFQLALNIWVISYNYLISSVISKNSQRILKINRICLITALMIHVYQRFMTFSTYIFLILSTLLLFTRTNTNRQCITPLFTLFLMIYQKLLQGINHKFCQKKSQTLSLLTRLLRVLEEAIE